MVFYGCTKQTTKKIKKKGSDYMRTYEIWIGGYFVGHQEIEISKVAKMETLGYRLVLV